MKKHIVVLVALLGLSAVTALAEKKSGGTDTNLPPEQVAASYTKAIEGRTDGVLKALALTNAAAGAKVHDAVIAQYRALKAWHEANDAQLKAAKGDANAVGAIRASLKILHNGFLAKLGEVLTPAQVETVKDKLTYGKVQFTFGGYVAQYPALTEEQKQKVLELLKEAREEAMDGGSADEKTAVFQRYKGKINNYLSKQGLHPAKAKLKAVAAGNDLGK